MLVVVIMVVVVIAMIIVITLIVVIILIIAVTVRTLGLYVKWNSVKVFCALERRTKKPPITCF